MYIIKPNEPFQISAGSPSPLGLDIKGDIANFALFSQNATQVILGIFFNGTVKEIPMQKTGSIWHISLIGIPKNGTYAYKCFGPKEKLFNPEKWLADPYAKVPENFIQTQIALPSKFDWQGVRPPRIASQDLVIYETHVRGFTIDGSSGVQHRGTYLGFIEKIPHLKKLGVNAVELLPIFEFNETYLKKPPLINYWGYNPTHFFAPKKSYAYQDPISELKTLVRELHRNGILVFLDAVYNHTGEGKEKDYYVNFRGIDNDVYYMLENDGKYSDYSRCGNTFNVNHPQVQQLILDSLHYWVKEMHIDGFRFDLASIFTRNTNGQPMTHPPLIEKISNDPILAQVKLIAEAWDASGLYQLGLFPTWGAWSEWNGRYRDVVRQFIKGTDNKAGLFANVISGSETIYSSSKTPMSSINFITAHDGFCLKDLVTYQNKHNLDNGENNLDGSDQNDNWNCGIEGEGNDIAINTLRERQMRNFLLALFISQGIPMILMGDEYGHTRKGNNNPYVQDNELNWFLWDKQDPRIVQFVTDLIAFRKNHPELRKKHFLTDADVKWFNSWDPTSRFVSFHLQPNLFIAFNAHYEKKEVSLPQGSWQIVINTEEQWVVHSEGEKVNSIELCPHSALLAIRSLNSATPIDGL